MKFLQPTPGIVCIVLSVGFSKLNPLKSILNYRESKMLYVYWYLLCAVVMFTISAISCRGLPAAQESPILAALICMCMGALWPVILLILVAMELIDSK